MIYIALLSYALPIYILSVRRFPVISPPTFFLIFFLIAYGPHTCFPFLLEEAANLSAEVHRTYLLMVVLANFGMAFGFALGNIFIDPVERRRMLGAAFARAKPISKMQSFAPLAIVCLGLALALLALDAPTFPRTSENLKYIFRTSEFTYSEIRRTLFAESAITIAQSYIRNGIGPILIALIWIKILKNSRSVSGRVVLFVIFTIFFIASILTLNKLPALYVLICVAGALYIYKNGVVVGITRRVPLILVAAMVLLALLEFLYRIQYYDLIQSGRVTVAELRELLLYRPFIGQADKLHFWADQWPNRQEFIGFRNFRPIAVLFGLDYYVPSQELPRIYLTDFYHSGRLTSWQTGFMGSGYASWGLPGVFGYGVFCGGVTVLVTKVVVGLRHRDISAAAIIVCSLTTFYFTSAELSIALLSGSVVLAPLFAKVLDSSFGRRDRVRRRRLRRFGPPSAGPRRVARH